MPRQINRGTRFNDGALDRLAEAPLSDYAQTQHRNVLLVSSLAVLIAQLNLVPTKISALGVDLKSDDLKAIRIALLLAVVYLLAAFLAAAMADYTEWASVRGEAKVMRANVEEALRDADIAEKGRWADQLVVDPDKLTSAWSEYEAHLDSVRQWTAGG